MNRVAIFVDAGYLFAQGSALLKGVKQPRSTVILNDTAAILALKSQAAKQAPGCGLLRIYWYDAPPPGNRPSGDQSNLAFQDDVKLRLGFLSGSGQQKGVDSLIVTDLIELARNKAISDAILVSGDEDIRVGVQIAQNYGVRVHLLGIKPGRGSQSLLLLQEADTTAEWSEAEVGQFLTFKGSVEAASPSGEISVAVEAITRASATTVAEPSVSEDAEKAIQDLLSIFVSEVEQASKEVILKTWTQTHSIPPEFDRKLLARARDALNRDLVRQEKAFLRMRFITSIRAI